MFLIVVDTLRPDRLSCYGYSKHRTSQIDRLAGLGVRLNNAQSTASWTTPSMGAILTSLYPTQLGLVEQRGVSWEKFNWRQKRAQRNHVFSLRTRTLAEVLRDAGFYTGAFVNQPALNVASCYRKGFTDWYSPVGPGEIKKHDPAAAFTQQKWPSTKYADQNDWELVNQFEQWLGGNGDKDKLFCWVHLLTPHRPYEPAAKYAPPKPQDGRASASDRYDGEIRAVDDMIGHLLQSIETYVGLDRSLIVFTSDHGEAFGEHGMTEHGHTLHQEVIHVPLIIASATLPAGSVVEHQVSTIDLFPTILNLTGLSSKIPADLSGVSMVPLDASQRRTSLYSEGMLYGSTERSMIRNNFKVMYDKQDGACSLFDIVSDPMELVDIADQNAQTATTMCAEVQKIYQALQGDFRARFVASNDTKTSDERTRERERALEALKSLGYVGD